MDSRSPDEPTVSTTLAPEPGSVRQARTWVTRVLRQAGMDEHAEIAALVVSELVTNVVVHTDSPADLRLVVGLRGPRIEVCDDDEQLPRRREADADLTNGRGLGLIEAVCPSWGISKRDPGKCVWAELTR